MNPRRLHRAMMASIGLLPGDGGVGAGEVGSGIGGSVEGGNYRSTVFRSLPLGQLTRTAPVSYGMRTKPPIATIFLALILALCLGAWGVMSLVGAAIEPAVATKY